MGNAMGYQGSGEGTRQWYNPQHRIPSLNNNSHRKSPVAPRASTTTAPATQHSQQCISRSLKLGATVVLEIPYVGLSGTYRRKRRFQWAATSDGNVGPKQLSIRDLANPMVG